MFGGSTQFMAAALIERTGNALAPAWYMSGFMVIGLVAMIAARESAPLNASQPSAVESLAGS